MSVRCVIVAAALAAFSFTLGGTDATPSPPSGSSFRVDGACGRNLRLGQASANADRMAGFRRGYQDRDTFNMGNIGFSY